MIIFNVGDRVRVKRGAYKGDTGIVHRKNNGKDNWTNEAGVTFKNGRASIYAGALEKLEDKPKRKPKREPQGLEDHKRHFKLI